MLIKDVEILIVSDTHLGSAVCEAEKLLCVLKSWNYKRLILLGDIFDGPKLKIPHLKKSHRRIIYFIREKSKTTDIIWVRGNHDIGVTKIGSRFMKARVCEEYSWRSNGKKCLAMHGDQFDEFMRKNPITTEVFTGIYGLLQRIDQKRKITQAIKRMSKTFTRASETVAMRAIQYAKSQNAEFMFCGHTHHAMYRHSDGVHYFNTGCWTEAEPTFVAIDKDGPKIYRIKNR